MALFLVSALGFNILPGAGLFTAPVVAFLKGNGLDASTMISLFCSCLCSAMVVQSMVNFPFKSPPIMMMLAACCFSSCCSSVMLTKDTYDRFTHKSE